MKWTVPAIAAAFVFGAIIGGSYVHADVESGGR